MEVTSGYRGFTLRLSGPIGSGLRSPFVPREIQSSPATGPSTNSCRYQADQSSGASHPRIRRLGIGGTPTDGLVWTDRFVSGALPLAQKRAPKFRFAATRAPTLDSAHPRSRRRPRFHSLNDSCLMAWKMSGGGMGGGSDPYQ